MRKRYMLRAFVNMDNPFNVLYTAGARSVVVENNMTKTQAIRSLKQMRKANPQHKYRISKSKGFFGISIILGLALFVFCLALARMVESLFNFPSDVEELIRIGFLAIGIFGLLLGLLKSI